MSQAHIPFLIISPHFCSKKLKRLKKIGQIFVKPFNNLKEQLRQADLNYKTEFFGLSAILSAIILSGFFSGLIYYVSILNENEPSKTIFLTTATGIGSFLFMLFIYFSYPKIIADKNATEIDKHLLFALKDLLLHTSSGTSFYEAIIHIVNSNYGRISKEFSIIANDIYSGKSEEEAIKNLILRLKSESLKKIMWQILNSLKAGGNLKESLEAIVNDLIQQQRVNIVSYSNELNLWSLIYLLFAVAAPTIGMTLMIILSSFADMGITEVSLFLFIGVTTFVQFFIIGLIKSRRPKVEF
jgi:pilus assembly protein TadC